MTWSSKKGQATLVNKLIQNNIDVNGREKLFFQTQLMYASGFRHPDIDQTIKKSDDGLE